MTLGEGRACGRGWGLSSVMRFAHDSSLCGGSLLGGRVCGRGISPLRRRGGGRRPSASFPIAPATPSARSPCYLVLTQRWQVAAALSAAVTTTKPIGDRKHSQAEPTTSNCFVPFRHDQRTEPVWRLCDRPLETFARSLLKLCGIPTLAGRGGSVSRRDHNQAY